VTSESNLKGCSPGGIETPDQAFIMKMNWIDFDVARCTQVDYGGATPPISVCIKTLQQSSTSKDNQVYQRSVKNSSWKTCQIIE